MKVAQHFRALAILTVLSLLQAPFGNKTWTTICLEFFVDSCLTMVAFDTQQYARSFPDQETFR